MLSHSLRCFRLVQVAVLSSLLSWINIIKDVHVNMREKNSSILLYYYYNIIVKYTKMKYYQDFKSIVVCA